MKAVTKFKKQYCQEDKILKKSERRVRKTLEVGMILMPPGKVLRLDMILKLEKSKKEADIGQHSDLKK